MSDITRRHVLEILGAGAVGIGCGADDVVDQAATPTRINSWLREAESLGALRMLP